MTQMIKRIQKATTTPCDGTEPVRFGSTKPVPPEWECQACGWQWFKGGSPTSCPKCGQYRNPNIKTKGRTK